MKKHFLIEIGEVVLPDNALLNCFSFSVYGSLEDAQVFLNEQLAFLIQHNSLFELKVKKYNSCISEISSVNFVKHITFNSEGGVINECYC